MEIRDMEIKMTKLREEANNGRKINAEKIKKRLILTPI
jgi:phosphotransferase system IIB component